MKIAILAGSNRKDATSTQLARYIGKLLEAEGSAVRLFDCFETPLPFYDPDAESTDHPALEELKRTVFEADGVVLATPEYHGSMSGVLKNALDHLGYSQFDSKPVLAVASAGGPVGVSSLNHIQTVVRNLHGINCPEWISIGGDQRSFGPDGEPAHGGTRDRVQKATAYFTAMVRQTEALRSNK